MDKETAAKRIDRAMFELEIIDSPDSEQRKMVEELVELMPENVDEIPTGEFVYQLLTTVLKMKRIALAMSIGQDDDYDSISALRTIEVKDWTQEILNS